MYALLFYGFICDIQSHKGADIVLANFFTLQMYHSLLLSSSLNELK